MDSTKNISQIFGENLRVYRTLRKLTQEKLAEMVGVTSQVISRYERGKMSPTFKTIEKLADILQVDAFRFFLDGKSGFKVISEKSLDKTGRRVLDLLCRENENYEIAHEKTHP